MKKENNLIFKKLTIRVPNASTPKFCIIIANEPTTPRTSSLELTSYSFNIPNKSLKTGITLLANSLL